MFHVKHPGSAGHLLEAYEALVRTWAPKLDLVAPGDLDRFRPRHIDDSLRILPLVRSCLPGPAADVGSGAGLPGIPLAIAEPGRTWRLLEPRSKRAGFLDEVVRSLDLQHVEVLRMTSEQAASDPALAAAHVLAVARALAPPAEAFARIRRLVVSGGIAVVFTGADAAIPVDAEVWEPGVATMRVERPTEGITT